MRKHRYKGLMKTISYYICGDGYDAEMRTDKIFTRAKKLIDKAYQRGRADAIDEFVKACEDECIEFYLNPLDCMREVAKTIKEQERWKQSGLKKFV